jgi:GNAT superfamily N-acetyltransferase
MAEVEVDIRLLDAEASKNQHLMREVTELINRVYAAAEDGQWLPGTTRTTAEEVTEYARAGEIVVARLGGGNGAVIGAMRMHRSDARIGVLGMLAADPEYRQMGIGQQVATFAQDQLRLHGISTLEMELLVPRDWHQPSKQVMAEWMERRGWRVVHKGALEDRYPDLAPRLATTCDFIVYQKPLHGPAQTR